MFGQTTAGTDGVRLLDEHHLVDEGLVELRRTDGRAQTGYHPAARCPPKVTEPTLSTATTAPVGATPGDNGAQPIRVPVVPAPMNSTSSCGNSRVIAGAVVRKCAFQLPGFAYWLSQTYRSSEAHSART